MGVNSSFQCGFSVGGGGVNQANWFTVENPNHVAQPNLQGEFTIKNATFARGDSQNVVKYVYL